MGLFAVLALGFFLGMRHATDPDHVIAVTAIVSRERSSRAAVMLGALWGVGHTATILVVGGAIVLFGLVIPPRLGLSMELSVAAMLVVLGAMNLVGAKNRIHEVVHGEPVRPSPFRPLIIGVVHGLAGSAAVALLVLATIRDPWWALFYLAIFGAGTVAGMTLLTASMAVPLALLAGRSRSVERTLARATGVLSIAFGVFLAYQIVVGNGLFAATPTWTPH